MSSTEVPAVRIESLVKEFPQASGTSHRGNPIHKGDTFRAVDALSLEIPEGAFYGLLGPNGAGKTTTIRILTGLSQRTSGRVEVRGHDVRDDFRVCRRILGLAPQEFDFDQFLTTMQVLVYRGMYYEIPRKEAKRRARELLARFELEHKADVRVHHLSGGQKRRLLIAKSLMHDPEVLILDEPTAGIDVGLRHDLWDYLRQLNRDGKTILLTTHYIEEAEALCDRVGIIDAGRLVAEGSPAELSQGSGSDSVYVRLSERCTHSIPLLEEASGLRIEAVEDDMALVASGGRGGAMATRLLEHLVGHGVKVENMEIRRQSLEDAFVQITGRRLDQTGDATGNAAKRGGNV